MQFYLRWVLLIFLGIALPLSSAQGQQLVRSEYLQTVSKEEINGIIGLSLAQFDVDLHKVWYTTLDINGVRDTASGLIMLPVAENLAFPLLNYSHGTVNDRNDVPSNLRGQWEGGAVFAGIGYVVSAPDYLGMGEARGFHPYVHAETEASASIDMLFATQSFVEQTEGIDLNDQLFTTGYSQGGHASMAIHRAIQNEFQDDFEVTAAAHLSGPYSISGTMFDLMIGEAPYFFVAYAPYALLSYDLAYDLFDEVEEIFKQPYAAIIEQFANEEIPLSTLNAMLIDSLVAAQGFPNARGLFQDSILMQIEDPDHPIRVALADNDTYDWAPEAPTALYYCVGDDQVTFRNSVIADSVMRANGAMVLTSVNLGDMLDHGACSVPAFTQTIFFFLQFQDVVTSTTEFIPGRPVGLAPNPASSNIRILNSPEGARLLIFDTQGRLVHQQLTMMEQTEVDVSRLENGIYLIRIIGNEGSWSERLLIQR